MTPIPFDAVQRAEAAIYSALRPLDKRLRDRVLRHVLDQLNSERAPLREQTR